jgi:hypothetical protein
MDHSTLWRFAPTTWYERAKPFARCCIGARSCIAVLAKLKQQNNDSNGDRLALAQSCLDALKQLRKSARGSLLVTLDVARDCIVAQKLGKAMTDPAVREGLQECISALEQFLGCQSNESAAAEKVCIDALMETRAAGTEFANGIPKITEITMRNVPSS